MISLTNHDSSEVAVRSLEFAQISCFDTHQKSHQLPYFQFLNSSPNDLNISQS